MLDNEGLTYNRPKRPMIPVNQRQSERALITVDRSQKLDLLIHLLTNLHQSLVICGPKGIGKSTLLKTLESSHQDIWPIDILLGSSALSFESVVNQLSRFLNLSSANVTFDLSALRAFCDKQTVVLVIDDAGELMPGLVGELMDFADSLTGLRLVFAMSNDDLATKSASDSAIDACHFIEIPPLNQRQCLEFLQNLSAQPGSVLAFSAINDDLVENLYRRTLGIPGKLLAELPNVQNFQTQQHWKLSLWAGLAVVCVATAFAVNYRWPTDSSEKPILAESNHTVTDVELPPPIPMPVASSDNQVIVDKHLVPADELLPESSLAKSLPAVTLPIAEAEPVAAISESTSAETHTPTETVKAPIPNEIANPDPELIKQNAPILATDSAAEGEQQNLQTTQVEQISEDVVEKPAPTTTPKVAEKQKSTKSEAENPDIAWIMEQPPNHYTVQVMVLSSHDSVTRLKRKYAQYGDALKAYPVGKVGQEKYVIIYGSFPTAIEALNIKSDMPSDFTSGLVKPFKQVQRQSRRK